LGVFGPSKIKKGTPECGEVKPNPIRTKGAKPGELGRTGGEYPGYYQDC